MLFLAILALCGCVERRLFVNTEPPGAFVRVNSREVGHAPTEWRFDHYGEVLVEAELAGYEPLEAVVKLKTPWYQKPLIDFFADVLWPGTIHDHKQIVLRLRKVGDPSEDSEEKLRLEAEDLARNAEKLKAEAKGK